MAEDIAKESKKKFGRAMQKKAICDYRGERCPSACPS